MWEWVSQSRREPSKQRRAAAVGGGCCLTVSRDVELDEVLEVLNIRRQSLDLVVTQPKFAKSVEAEEIL